MSCTPITCNCGRTLLTDAECIDHCVKCDKLPYSKTTRHNNIRHAVTTVARQFGIACTEEPKIYEDLYENGHQRPDILFQLNPPLSIDITCVHPELEVDVAAENAAKVKRKQHEAVMEKLNHKFLPFTLETYGHLNQSVFKVISELERSVPSYQAYRFRQTMLHAVSTAVAISRADAIRTAILHMQRANQGGRSGRR